MTTIKRLLALSLLPLLLGCTSVKVSKPMLKMIVDATIKLSEAPVYADSCRHTIGLPYAENGSGRQVLDVYYAPESVRRDIVLIDIHGGFYVGGDRRNNRVFASAFLREGIDVVLLEYRLNDGKDIDVETELGDCAAALDYLTDHTGELGLNRDAMFLTGDSAGGHFALYLAEGAEDRSLPVHPERFVPRGVLLNCPAYDYEAFAITNGFTRSALEWFIGPRYRDTAWMASMSPRTRIGSYTGPLFVSTCKNDFIRGESLKLISDCEALGREVEFIDIHASERKVGHVHNVTDPALPESREVNDRMIAFMNNN
ncbi:MAG: alpha/beta hydrolase [Bacteroidales bacterium]|nr:alpha/beta hydrolase [Clostridia bacterium]MBR1782993.1 alpha/beta hydrolase [Bacteroidales bacterium]